jgi:hypothetical protein
MGPDGVPNGGQTGWLVGGSDGAGRGWLDGGPDGAGRGARRGPEGVPDGWPNGVPDGARRGPDGARRSARRAKRGGGWKDYLLLKEKMTCSVYVSCKSSSTSDVSDAG